MVDHCTGEEEAYSARRITVPERRRIIAVGWITVPERRRIIARGGSMYRRGGGLWQVVDHCTGEEEDFSGWWVTAPERRRIKAGGGSLHQRRGG